MGGFESLNHNRVRLNRIRNGRELARSAADINNHSVRRRGAAGRTPPLRAAPKSALVIAVDSNEFAEALYAVV